MIANLVEFGFVAALEREVSGVVRGWSATEVQSANGVRRIYQTQNAALICAGTGTGRAYAASKLLVEKYSPRVLISMGFAGASADTVHLGFAPLHPGSIVVPASVVEAATGRNFVTAFGLGQLATLDRVAGRAMKLDAHERFGAQIVDMEAAGVAAAAVEAGRQFVAIKAISDGVDEDLGFLADFVKPDGFETGRFIAHIAVRPWLWRSVAVLQTNSELAAKSLVTAVASCMKDWQGFSARYSSAAKQEKESS